MNPNARRTLTLALPAILAAAAGLAQQGCSRDAVDAPSMIRDAAETKKQKIAEADRQLSNDVAFLSAATVRCSQPNATSQCVKEAAADVAKLKLRPQGLRIQGLDEVLNQLPIKETICAVVRGLTMPSSSPATEASDAGAAEDSGAEDAGPVAALEPSLFIQGGPLPAAAPGAGVADEVWDLAHGQVAVLVHPQGGIGTLAGIAGSYTASAAGSVTGVIAGWAGAFTGGAGGKGVQKLGGGLIASVQAADVGPQYLPELGGLKLPSAPVYVPWDAATEKLSASLFALQPKILGEAGAKYIQIDSLVGSNTVNGAVPIGVAMLMNAKDEGDFQSLAGKPVLAGVTTNILDRLGIGIDAWCGPAGGSTNTDGTTDITGGSSSCDPYEDDGRCGSGNSCAWNGDGYCCRPEPTASVADEGCRSTDDCVANHGTGWVCSNRRDRLSVCVLKATCR